MVFLGFEAKTFDMHTPIKATTLRKFWLDFGDIYKKKIILFESKKIENIHTPFLEILLDDGIFTLIQ